MTDQLTKKERQQALRDKLQASKAQRLEMDRQEREERMRPMKTYFPYSNQDKKRLTENRFDDYDRQREYNRSQVQSQATEPAGGDEEMKKSTVERFTDPQASYKIDQHNKVTYQLLERDMKGRDVLHLAEERIGQDLEKVRQQKIVERMEFEKQIEDFNQKELLKVLHKKEMLNANKDYWNQ